MDISTLLPLLLLVVAVIAVLALTKQKRQTSGYDEMQLKIRARGYKIGFFTALILLAVTSMLSETGTLLTLVTPGFSAFAVLIVSVVVFAVYCIVHDAFVAICGNARSFLIIAAMVVLINGISAVRHITLGTLLEEGRLGFSGGTNILMCLGFLTILITLIVKTLRNRKEAEE